MDSGDVCRLHGKGEVAGSRLHPELTVGDLYYTVGTAPVTSVTEYKLFQLHNKGEMQQSCTEQNAAILNSFKKAVRGSFGDRMSVM